MRTASKVLGFTVGAVALSTVFLGGTAEAATVTPHAGAQQVSTDCTDNLNWDGVGPCSAEAN